MIITKTPLRLSFVGGGSDLPTFYEKYGGAVISCTINKYVYINVHESFDKNVRVAYSRVEEATEFNQIEHPLVRNAARMMGINTGLEITSIADIPSSGSGLGSSSSFSVGLLHALCVLKKLDTSRATLAELACNLEIGMCGQPIGKQDQYAASFGGFNVFRFEQDGLVNVEPLQLDVEIVDQLQKHIMVFYTGKTRSASKILADQSQEIKNKAKSRMLGEMVALVDPFKQALEAGDMRLCGELLDTNWQLKTQLANGISSSEINKMYMDAMAAGAWGGKLLGAGGSGFMLFLVPPKSQSAVATALSNYPRQYWQFDNAGSTIIHSS